MVKSKYKRERKKPPQKPKTLATEGLPTFKEIIGEQYMSEKEKKTGHKTKYTPEKAQEVCDRIISGETMISICRDPNLWSWSTNTKYTRKYPEYKKMFDDAMKQRAIIQMEVLLDMADGRSDYEKDVHEKRLKADIYKWVMARMNRSVFGDHQEIDHKVQATKIIRLPEKKQLGASVDYNDDPEITDQTNTFPEHPTNVIGDANAEPISNDDNAEGGKLRDIDGGQKA